MREIDLFYHDMISSASGRVVVCSSVLMHLVEVYELMEKIY